MALAIFHARRAFHKSRKGFISLKRNTFCLADKRCFFSGTPWGIRTPGLLVRSEPFIFLKVFCFLCSASARVDSSSHISDMLFLNSISSKTPRVPGCLSQYQVGLLHPNVSLSIIFSLLVRSHAPHVTIYPFSCRPFFLNGIFFCAFFDVQISL